MLNIVEHLQSLDITQLKEIQHIIDGIISDKSNRPYTSPSLQSVTGESEVININDFVEYSQNFVSEDDKQLLLGELGSLNLKSAKTGKVSNAWISQVDEPYIWDSSSGPVVNEARDINNFPVLKRVLDKINLSLGCELNSVLVAYMRNGYTSLRLHDDNEVNMDSKQPICLVSLGSRRKIEFVDKRQVNKWKTCLSLQPDDKSMYVMKPGCQTYFEHRVRKNIRVRQERFSLSFRRMIPSKELEKVTPPPVKNLIESFDTPGPTPILPPLQSDNTSTPNFVKNQKATSLLDNAVGFSPFPKDDTHTSKQSSNSGYGSANNDRYCVIFGTSITEPVDGEKLSRGTRKVINYSESGAKIEDIREAVRDFCIENPCAINKVDKVIICVGVNDIKYFDSIKYDLNKRFRKPLIRLINQVKLLLPNAQIIFQSVLPMKLFYVYCAKSVHEFNYLLLELCGLYGCIFHDCFSGFLDEYGYNYNSSLYRDKWHLNDFGLIILCRAIKFVIYKSIFHPIMRINNHNYYYYDW